MRRTLLILTAAFVMALVAPAMAKVLKGTPGNDKIVGSKTADKIYGKAGNDKLLAQEGSDLVVGGSGKDLIKGGKKFDEIRGGKGKDEIHTRDGVPDQVDCGPGVDTVLADEVEDGLIDCEKVKVLAP